MTPCYKRGEEYDLKKQREELRTIKDEMDSGFAAKWQVLEDLGGIARQQSADPEQDKEKHGLSQYLNDRFENEMEKGNWRNMNSATNA